MTVLIVGLTAAAVPFSYCAFELSRLESSIASVGQTTSDLNKVRGVVENLAQTLINFTMITVDADRNDQAVSIDATDKEFLIFKTSIGSITQFAKTILTEREALQLSGSIGSLEHSWEELRLNPNSGTIPDIKAHHFPQIYEGIKSVRENLQKLDRAAARASQHEMDQSFKRIETATQALLLIVLIGALVSVAASIAMFQAAEKARNANVALRQREDDMQLQSARFEAALENMSQGLCMFDNKRQLIICNQRYATLYGLNPEQLRPGTGVEIILELRVAAGASPKDAATYVADRLHEATTNHSYKIVHELLDGRFISVSHEPLPDGGWVATHEDITEKKLAETKIVHMAHHDALTGLPNRVVLGNWLQQRLGNTASEESFAVLALDLDLFKRVNDTLGHQFGDLLLCQVADRLRDSTRDSDLVVRLGGDEFAIVQTAPDQPAAATSLAQRVIAVLNEPFDLDGHQIVIGASIGVAIAPVDGEKPYQLIKNADLALYRAKADGRNTYRFFERTMDAKMQARRILEVDLRKALSDDELELVYQPIVNLASEKIVGFEALLRWNHPTRGRVAPDDFIPLAEEIGLIGAIGEWVLRQACAEATTWPAHIKVAVNLSPVQFRSQTLAHSIISILGSSGLSPSRLELEVTETVLVNESDAVPATLEYLRGVGIRIAMDDFGTGYSSMSYLQRFPFDKIKIDRCFMQRTTTDKDAFAIVRAVISLGKSLGMIITAEGVETQEQFDRLVAEGCTEVQGYLISQPRSATEARRFLATYNAQALKAVA